MSEVKPLILNVKTRKTYLICPETMDTLCHKYHSKDDTTVRSVRLDDNEYCTAIQSKIERKKSHENTETLNDGNMEEEGLKRQNYQPTDSTAYVQKLESFFNCFSSSLYLENNASVARDHMANERTYLAWVRTSLSTISIGIAISQLFMLDKDSGISNDLAVAGWPMSTFFIATGMLYLAFSFIRYFHSQVAMAKGHFPSSRGNVIFATASILTAFIAVFIIIYSKQ